MTRSDFGRTAAGWARVLMGAVMAVGCGTGSGVPSQGAKEPAALGATSLQEESDSNPRLFDVNSHPYGTSMKEWAYDWWRWEYSIPAATNPFLVAGADYDQNQPERVFFVPAGPNHDDAFTVPRHKAVGIMLSQIGNDYPCPDPTFQPAPGQSLFDFLATGLTAINDSITVLEVTLDGVPVHDPKSYRFTSTDLFYFTGDPSLTATFDSCVTGASQPAVTDDLFLLFKPLSRGQHVITTHIENSHGHVFNRRHTITSE